MTTAVAQQPQSSDAAAAALPTVSSFSFTSPTELRSESAASSSSSSPPTALPWSCTACARQPFSSGVRHTPLPFSLAASLLVSLFSPSAPQPNPQLAAFTSSHHLNSPSASQLQGALSLLSQDLSALDLSSGCDSRSLPSSVREWVMTHHVNCQQKPQQPSSAAADSAMDVPAVRIHEDVGEQADGEQAAAPHLQPSQQPSQQVKLLFHPDPPPMPSLHINSTASVSPSYDWKFIPSRPLPQTPNSTAVAAAAAAAAAAAPVVGVAVPSPARSGRSQSFLNPARSAYEAAASAAALSSNTKSPPLSHSPASAPPALAAQTSPRSAFSSSSRTESPAPLSSRSQPAGLAFPSQSRSTSAPADHHQSRYSIVGLPRPRRLAPVSPTISSAAFQHGGNAASPPSPLPSHLMPQQSPSSLLGAGQARQASASVPGAKASSLAGQHPRKSWDLRDMWVNREQEEIRREEERQAARIRQLTRAMNICRLLPHSPRVPLSEAQVAGAVRELKLDLSRLDVGHITTMEREELMLDSAQTLLAVLQLLSSPQLSLQQVKERIAALRLSPDIAEYIIFFFVDAPAHLDHASRAYSRQSSRSRLSLRHPSPPQLSSSSAALSSPAPLHPSPRDLLSELTSYINRRQKENRINAAQLQRYAQKVGFDLAAVDLKEAEAVLGASKEEEEAGRRSEEEAKEAKPQEEQKELEEKQAAGDRADGGGSSAQSSPPPAPVELQSARQVVIALQMVYESTVYDDDLVLSICRAARMQPETTDYLLQQNRRKRREQQEQDRRERRSIKVQQHIAAAAAAASPSSAASSSSSAPSLPLPPPPKHWPVTAEDVSALISNHRLCQGWINDADELQELIRVTPLDLSAISPVMIEGLLAADLRFDSPRQVVQALRLLYADLSEEDVKAECRRFSLPSAALPYILQHRVQHELELEELTVEEVRAEAVRQHRRKKQAAQKAMSVLRFDLSLGDEDEEQEVQLVQARQVTLTQLTDSLRQSRLWEGQDVMITEAIVSQLLVKHPFPLSSMDLQQLDSMERESLSFSSPAQLMSALQLLHVDISDDEVQIECRRQGLQPAVAQYIIRHERPIHAEVVISREDSRSRKRGSGGKGSARRSLSLVETLAGGHELVEEWVATSSIADLIGGSTTAEQIVAAVREARVLEVEDEAQQSLDAQQVAAVARELEFDLSVVDLEMIPILASHASHFQSVPQLLTALQLLYTDVSDAEIRSECEEVGMDRKTTRFLVKNSLRTLLLSRPELSQLDGELVLSGGEQRKPGWSDPRYARVVYDRGDDVGVEQLVDASQLAETEHTPLDSRLLMQLLQLFSLLDRSSADATAPPSVQEQRLAHALAEVGFELSVASKEMLLRLYSADCRFPSLLQLVHCLHLLYADLSAEGISAYCSQLRPPFSRQVTDFIAAHSLRQQRRRRAQQSRHRSPRDNDGSSGSSWFTSTAQLGDLVDQFQLLSPSGCTAAALDVALQSVGLELQQVRLADLAKLAEHKMSFSTPAQLVSTLQLLQWDVAGEEVQAEAARRALPSSVLEYLQEHHAEHLQFIQRGRKREWRRRHVTRYISHDLQREDGDELQGEEVQPARQQLKAKAKAMQAKLSYLQSELLAEGVEVEEQEVEEWISQFPLSVHDLSVDCVDLIVAQLSAAPGRGGEHRRLGSVRDALQCVLDLSLEIADRAEEEMVTTTEMVRMMAAGERETPTVVNVSPHSQSASSASVFRGLAPPTASHSRVSSTPNSARSTSHGHQPLQSQHSAPVLNTAAVGNGSHNSSPSPSPSNASTRPRVSRHHRGAHSVSWNARTREAVLGGSSASDPVKDVEKRSAQILQLKRIIVQNALVMIPAALEPPHSPLPPALLSERNSLPASPISAPQTAQERAAAVSASASAASPPVSGRQLPPPIPSGIQAGYNTKVSPNGSPSLTPSAIGLSATVSPSTPLLSSVSAPAAPLLVAASLSDLDSQYNWDAIVDVVYSIHVICELIKWRAVHSPNLAFPSVAALFDFLHDPECAVFEPEDDLLSLQRTAMELTENDAERDRERDHTLTAYEERSTLHTASRSRQEPCFARADAAVRASRAPSGCPRRLLAAAHVACSRAAARCLRLVAHAAASRCRPPPSRLLPSPPPW